VNQQTLQEFIRGLDLPETVRQELADLTPSTYTGNAGEQARSI
jgi:adenylosuccinate lyase